MRVPGSAIVLLIAFLVYSSVAKPATAVDDLELTTAVARQRYCTGDADLDGVLLRIKLRYRNVGTRSVILHKSSVRVFKIIVRASPNGEIESNARLSWYSDGPWKLNESSLKKAFVILQPQATYATETDVRVFVKREEAHHIEGAVAAGDHYLQVTIGTWGGSSEMEDALRQKWQSYGFLWTDSVISQPMKFTIAKKRTVRDCN